MSLLPAILCPSHNATLHCTFYQVPCNYHRTPALLSTPGILMLTFVLYHKSILMRLDITALTTAHTHCHAHANGAPGVSALISASCSSSLYARSFSALVVDVYKPRHPIVYLNLYLSQFLFHVVLPILRVNARLPISTGTNTYYG